MSVQCHDIETAKLARASNRGWTSRHPFIALMLLGFSSALLIGLASLLGGS